MYFRCLLSLCTYNSTPVTVRRVLSTDVYLCHVIAKHPESTFSQVKISNYTFVTNLQRSYSIFLDAVRFC
jgi:hypothetical protein